MGEYYRFNDKDKSGGTGTHKSWADYLQIGKSFNNLTPYVRFERTVLDQLDNFLACRQAANPTPGRRWDCATI